MINLLLTPKTEEDLEEIFAFTSLTWGFEQAERYQDELFHGMNLICEDFEIGVKYPYSKYDYRKLHINKHLIFYRIEGQNCIVVRILHDRMNLREHL